VAARTTGGCERLTTGWRHVYTWSRRGSLGAPGFQTVGRSQRLEERRDDGRLRALERVVAGLRPPAGGTSLFLQPSPVDAGWSVLTRSVATGRSADGRPGGFVAESVGVPDRWLNWLTPVVCERRIYHTRSSRGASKRRTFATVHTRGEHLS
jgi:hypothetical protein